MLSSDSVNCSCFRKDKMKLKACPIHLKQSQSSLFCSVTYITVSFTFTCMLYAECKTSIDSGVCHMFWSIL